MTRSASDTIQQPISTLEIQRHVVDAAMHPSKAVRRAARHALGDALLRDGHTRADARTLADRLIAEARRAGSSA